MLGGAFRFRTSAPFAVMISGFLHKHPHPARLGLGNRSGLDDAIVLLETSIYSKDRPAVAARAGIAGTRPESFRAIVSTTITLASCLLSSFCASLHGGFRVAPVFASSGDHRGARIISAFVALRSTV